MRLQQVTSSTASAAAHASLPSINNVKQRDARGVYSAPGSRRGAGLYAPPRGSVKRFVGADFVLPTRQQTAWNLPSADLPETSPPPPQTGRKFLLCNDIRS